MKKNMQNILYVAFAALLMSGCKGFLDVNPKGEVFDKDMFSSSEKYEDALYGVYSEIAGGSNLYGGSFHWAAEIMSGNVTAIQDNVFGNIALGKWDNNGPVKFREDVWSDAYKAINHVNNIILNSGKSSPDKIKNLEIYRGEALAIRALLHFELLRYFGAPVWAGEEFKKTAIPYVTKYTFDIAPFLSLNEAYDKVLEELKEAEKLLAKDKEYVTAVRDNNPGTFLTCRITHLNLYAVYALMARVYWTLGDMDNAAIYAEKVISSGKFSFRPKSAFVQPDNGTIDLHETIFGLYSTDYQNVNKVKYGFGNLSATGVFTLASDWKSIYENGSGTGTDYRLGAWFDDSEHRLKKLVNPVYYEGADSKYKGKSILACNILRLPEMYFIMAEKFLKSDPAKAAEYYDAVVKTRGVETISESGTVLTYDMLYTERRKEFYGEGFTWHEMKKTGKDINTVEGTVLSGNLPTTFIVPIPVSEEEWRKKFK